MGGLFGVVAMIVSIFGITYLTESLLVRRGSVLLLELAFLIFLIYLIVWTIGASVAVSDQVYAVPAMIESFSTIAIWVAVYFVGAKVNLFEPAPSWVIKFLIVSVLACFVHAAVKSGSFLGPFLMFMGDQEGADTGATYQGIGRGIVVLAVVFASLAGRISGQLTVLAGAVIVLLALGSRAHLFVTGLLLVVHIALFAFRGRNLRAGLVATIVILLAGYFAASVFLETRSAEILDLTQSNSWQARQEAHHEALRVIETNPLLGGFGYYLGDSKGYAHNILSAWAEYGLVGFLMFIGLMLYALGVSGKQVLFRSLCPPVWIIAFQFNLVALVLALTSEPILSSVFPALGWGFTVQALRSERQGRASMPTNQPRSSVMNVSVR